MSQDVIISSPDSEIATIRMINFSVEKVYEAWTNPIHLQNWWGPAGFTNTFNKFDLRPGGKWDFVMHGPDKGHYHNECEFVQIESLRLISWKRHSKPLFNVLATFEKITEHQTRVVFKMIFDTPAEMRKAKTLRS